MNKRRCASGKRLIVIALLIGHAPAPAANVSAQEQSRIRIRLGSAYERGYVAGYADGYTVGKNDYASRFNRNFRQHTLYFEADRGYESLSGSFVDYIDEATGADRIRVHVNRSGFRR